MTEHMTESSDIIVGSSPVCRICEEYGFSVDGYLEEALRKLEARPELLADEAEYTHRLSVCEKCEYKMADGCCRMCGCYVVLRARTAAARCPMRNRWKHS